MPGISWHVPQPDLAINCAPWRELPNVTGAALRHHEQGDRVEQNGGEETQARHDAPECEKARAAFAGFDRMARVAVVLHACCLPMLIGERGAGEREDGRLRHHQLDDAQSLLAGVSLHRSRRANE